MRRLTRAILVAVLLSLCLTENASAATVKVLELDFVFAPDPAKARLGDTVTWRNQVEQYHTTTDGSPLLLWDSGLMWNRESFSYTFTAAGTYPYFCELHTRFGMFGTVLVRDAVSPPSGPPGTIFTVTVASVVAPPDFVYDVQKRNPGGVFQDWRLGVTDASVAFDSTGQLPGTYGFRSLLRRVSDGLTTQYSPGATITVTG